MTACGTPAGYLRHRFGFEFLPDYDNRQWTAIKRRADGRIHAASANARI